MKRAASLLGCLLLAASCNSSSGGPELAEVAIGVTDVDRQATDSYCTLLPVLLGGRVDESARLLDRLDVRVVATRDAAIVSFEPGAYRRRISVGELRNGRAFDSDSDPDLLVTTNDAVLSVRLSSNCAVP